MAGFLLAYETSSNLSAERREVHASPYHVQHGAQEHKVQPLNLYKRFSAYFKHIASR